MIHNTPRSPTIFLCAFRIPWSSRADIESLGTTEKGWAQRANLATGQRAGKPKSQRQRRKSTNGPSESSLGSFPTRQPTSSMEFDRDWRRHCRCRADKMRYLKLCTAANFREIFSKIQIDSTLLGGVIKAFADEAKDDGDIDAALLALEYLRSIPSISRFELVVELMGTEEKAHLSACFDWLHEHARALCATGEEDSSRCSAHITDEEVSSVAACYR